jgi:tetratricopeptide (TPR) repeat protein
MNEVPEDSNEDQAKPNAMEQGARKLMHGISEFTPRDHWWHLLDRWEAHRRLRLAVYSLLAVSITLTGLYFFAYPQWQRRTSVNMIRGWLDAGKLQNAAVAAQEAIQLNPDNAEAWSLAAECARLLGDNKRAVVLSQMAVDLEPDNPDYVLDWAMDALQSGQLDVARRAMDGLSDTILATSSRGQRILGELSRRQNNWAAARQHFELAGKLDGPAAVNEVPLGIVLLADGTPAERQRGRDLLAKWMEAPQWSVTCERTLLDDAIRRGDKPAMLDLANKLRANPKCTLGDIPVCLQALSLADETRFYEVLAGMKTKHAASAEDAALLLGWLNQIGRSRDAVTWAYTLPAALIQNPPGAVMVAEGLRLNADWDKLQAWTQGGNWGENIDSIRIAYGLLAAKKRGNSVLIGHLWDQLQKRTNDNGGRALFVADNLYAWGMNDEALTLLWKAADQRGSSLQALGTLARHYQVNRDADGQYRVFRQLLTLRAKDPAILNNYIFFAALTGNNLTTLREQARANFEANPTNPDIRATLAFVLFVQERYPRALEVLQPVVDQWPTSPGIAFVYGLLLARTDTVENAQKVLASIDPTNLTTAEVELIRTTLGPVGSVPGDGAKP